VSRPGCRKVREWADRGAIRTHPAKDGRPRVRREAGADLTCEVQRPIAWANASRARTLRLSTLPGPGPLAAAPCMRFVSLMGSRARTLLPRCYQASTLHAISRLVVRAVLSSARTV
jgi:hypothetical protein